jgi:hypothetical protein
MMYRVKHKKTGLYFMKSHSVRVKYKDKDGVQRESYTKTNLSKKGRVYTSVPCSKWYVGHTYNHIEHQRVCAEALEVRRTAYSNFTERTTEADWEVEEVSMVTGSPPREMTMGDL